MTGIVGLTHSPTGKPLVRLVKTLKVGIGYPKGKAIHVFIRPNKPNDLWVVEIGTGKEVSRQSFQNRKDAEVYYREQWKTAPERGMPGKFGYFTFQRVGIDGSYTPDWDAIEMHGPMPTEIGIVFLDNTPLHQQMEWWTTAELKCSGDGRNAMRRLSEAKSPAERQAATEASGKGEQFFPIANGCWAYGCQYARGEKPVCKPHTRLNFQLVNAPALGSTCSFDSTGFRSATQLFSSIHQILTITGRGNADEGVVAGIPLTLKLLPYKTSHNGRSSKQFGVTVHLKASDALELMRKVIAAGAEFKQIAGAPLRLSAPERESTAEEYLTEAAEAASMEAEYYPAESDDAPAEEWEFPEGTEEAAEGQPAQPKPEQPQVRRKSERQAERDAASRDQVSEKTREIIDNLYEDDGPAPAEAKQETAAEPAPAPVEMKSDPVPEKLRMSSPFKKGEAR